MFDNNEGFTGTVVVVDGSHVKKAAKDLGLCDGVRQTEFSGEEGEMCKGVVGWGDGVCWLLARLLRNFESFGDAFIGTDHI